MWNFLKVVEKMQALAQELAQTTVTGEGAEGKVRIVLSGHQQVQAVHIDPTLSKNRKSWRKGSRKPSTMPEINCRRW